MKELSSPARGVFQGRALQITTCFVSCFVSPQARIKFCISTRAPANICSKTSHQKRSSTKQQHKLSECASSGLRQSWAIKKNIVKRKHKFCNQNFSSLKRKRKFRNQKFLSSKRKRKFRNQNFLELKRKRKFHNQNFFRLKRKRKFRNQKFLLKAQMRISQPKSSKLKSQLQIL